MIQENGFKETDIGVIPEDWGLGTLGSLFDIQQGKSVSPKSRKGISPQPFLRTANVFWGQIDLTKLDQMDFNDTEINKLLLKADDLLICEGGDIGRTAIWENQIPLCMYQNHLHRLRTSRENVIPRFYMYWMQASLTLFGLYEGTGNKTTIPNLSMSRLSSFVVPVPEKKEQLFIVLVMNKIQQAIAHQEKFIEKTKELKRSLMQRLFTYGLRGEELKETEIGLMPRSWSVKKLKDVVEKTSQKDMTKTPDIQFKYIDVSSISNESLKIIGSTTYKGSEAPSRARKIVKVNDVLFATVRPTLKRIAYVSSEFDGEICSTAFCVLRVKPDTSSKYLFYGVQRDVFIDELAKLQRGASYPAVTDGNIKDQKIPLPSFEEQKEMAEALSVIDEKIENSDHKQEVLKDLFKSMLQLLMTGQLRVKDIDFGEIYPVRET
jgi:type I restriction enzyme S subunit